MPRCECGDDMKLMHITHWTKDPEHPERKIDYRELYKCQKCGEEEWRVGSAGLKEAKD